MDLTSILSSLLTSDNVDELAKSVGIDNAQAQAVIKAGLPLIMGQLKKNTQTQQGAQSLSNALDKHDAPPSSLTDLISGAGQEDAQKILGHILGQDKDKVQGQLSEQTGVPQDQVSSILGALAKTAMGSLGKAKKEGGLDTSGIINTVSSVSSQLENGGILDTVLTSVLDKNHDGKIQDDLIGMAVNWVKGQLSGK